MVGVSKTGKDSDGEKAGSANSSKSLAKERATEFSHM